MTISRRRFIQSSALLSAGALATPYFFTRSAKAADAVEVGVLFSLTGGLSIIEKSLADATLMAIDEINAAGGVLDGQMIKPIVEDGASDPKTYNEKASKLVIRDKVPTVFGSYTSASRKAVLPVFEKRNNLYFYPTYYEGFECSKNVVYTGAVPNQQLSNFIPWIIKNLGKKKFFIVGSNYIYPREMAKVCKILIEQAGAEWVADEYLELGHSEWGAMVKKIKDSGCDVVLSNVVASCGDALLAQLKPGPRPGPPDLRDGHLGNRDRRDGRRICRRQLHLVPLFPGDRHRHQQGLRRTLSQVCERPEGGDTPRTRKQLLPGIPVQAGAGSRRRGDANRHPGRGGRTNSTPRTATSRSSRKTCTPI